MLIAGGIAFEKEQVFDPDQQRIGEGDLAAERHALQKKRLARIGIGHIGCCRKLLKRA